MGSALARGESISELAGTVSLCPEGSPWCLPTEAIPAASPATKTLPHEHNTNVQFQTQTLDATQA